MSDQLSAILIHGTMGSPRSNWLPWLARHLEDRGVAVTVPTFPTPEGQSVESWNNALFRSAVLGPRTLVFGHSAGAAFLLHILAHVRSPIFASFFVAGFTREIGIPEYDRLNASFFAAGLPQDVIRRNAGMCSVFAGENDPYVPHAQAVELAALLDAPLSIIPNGQHLNAEAGYHTADFLLPALEDVISCAREAPTI